MLTQNPALPKTLNPSFSSFNSTFLPIFSIPLRKTLTQIHPKPLSITSHTQNAASRPDVRAFAGRSKKKPGGPSTGRILGDADLRRDLRRNIRRRSKQYAENLFYRLKNPHGNYANNFSEEQLQMIGLGYDRMVRFMEKDDPNLKHPYDWYKYGEFGPYSWRGVVLGEPIRGRFSDERVTLIGEVRDHEEWEDIERFEMETKFGERLKSMDPSAGFKYYWVFARHPKWRVSELPWEQWTLVSEVVVEAGKQRLDKWSLMGRLGNRTRSLVTQCAAWMRPDIIYVKRPVCQLRFEPQDEFFKAMTPLLDPETENNFKFELEKDDGRVELCTYFGGLCKIVRVNPKAFVDDVVKGYEKLSDEKKSKCLMFLLGNHPIELLHPYTKEWKAKLEEDELGCDAPDNDDDDYISRNAGETDVEDWIEDDGGDDDDDDADDIIMGAEGSEDDEVDDLDPEEDKDWDEEYKKAINSNEIMEDLAKQSVEFTSKLYKSQMKEKEEEGSKEVAREGGDEDAMRISRAKVSEEEWKQFGYGPHKKKILKCKAPPGLFLRAAVRPFTYKNLVKEIVLTRHALVEGEIGRKK